MGSVPAKSSIPTSLGFALKFMALFVLLMGAFEASRGGAFERFVVEDLILVPTVALINAVAPDEQVALVDRTLVSSGSRLHVTRGCEGIEMFLMLVAGILAFPASGAQRLRGLAVGSVIAYLLSVARLVTLHFILRYSPTAWEQLHGFVLPLAPIVVMGFYFMHWTGRALPRSPASEAHAA